MNTPIITICGRPNVGKSTLFNRLTGRRKSIVSEIPGTTRDSIQTNCLWNNKSFILVDSGGIETYSEDQITKKVIDKSYESINEADHILFVVDATSGITNEDAEILRLIRKADKNITLVINKVDNLSREENINDFFSLGLGEGINISAYHGNGIFDLMHSLEHLFSILEPDDESIKFSIIGRPNVGKSTLFNIIIGQAKSIVSEIPGTTRDSVDSKFKYENNDNTVVDTAGKRRKGKILGITSVVAFSGNPGQTNYTASKGGMIAMYKSLAVEVAQRNINVNLIAPGFIESPMTESLNEDQKNSIMEKIPMKKFGSPEDVANLALFLTSDYSSYITGQSFHVNGGMLML